MRLSKPLQQKLQDGNHDGYTKKGPAKYHWEALKSDTNFRPYITTGDALDTARADLPTGDSKHWRRYRVLWLMLITETTSLSSLVLVVLRVL